MEEFPSRFGAEVYRAEYGDALGMGRGAAQTVPELRTPVDIVSRNVAVEQGVGLGNEVYSRISRPVLVGEIVRSDQPVDL